MASFLAELLKPDTETEDEKIDGLEDGDGVVEPPPDPTVGWSENFINLSTNKPYQPHHADEERFVFCDTPRYALAKGGEGAGKSVAGVVKTLHRLRRGMSGIMVSPDFEHFKKSLWKEFARWCPWYLVIPEQQYRSRTGWEPTKPFTLSFTNGAELLCGGIEEPGAWEGPNVHFAYFDEARRHKTPDAMKVLAGRIRLAGPNNESPQLYFTTTPRKHWLYEYFGPILVDEPDPNLAFKKESLTVTLRVSDNAANLDSAYERQRRTVLTESEARVVMDAEWEDIEDVDRFLPSIVLWDACREELKPADKQTPLVLAADGAYAAKGDTFGLVAVSRHPANPDRLAVRAVWMWEATGKPRDFDIIQNEIKKICLSLNVFEIAYDPMQLHQMMTHLKKASQTEDGATFPGVMTYEFRQGQERNVSDKGLLDLIVARRIAHDSSHIHLRKHLDNADRKVDENKKLRIVKRRGSLKIDLAVCLSMASHRALERLPKSHGAIQPVSMKRESPWSMGGLS